MSDMKKVISTTSAPAAIGPYSQAVETGNMIFLSGQLPIDPKGKSYFRFQQLDYKVR